MSAVALGLSFQTGLSQTVQTDPTSSEDIRKGVNIHVARDANSFLSVSPPPGNNCPQVRSQGAPGAKVNLTSAAVAGRSSWTITPVTRDNIKALPQAEQKKLNPDAYEYYWITSDYYHNNENSCASYLGASWSCGGHPGDGLAGTYQFELNTYQIWYFEENAGAYAIRNAGRSHDCNNEGMLGANLAAPNNDVYISGLGGYALDWYVDAPTGADALATLAGNWRVVGYCDGCENNSYTVTIGVVQSDQKSWAEKNRKWIENTITVTAKVNKNMVGGSVDLTATNSTAIGSEKTVIEGIIQSFERKVEIAQTYNCKNKFMLQWVTEIGRFDPGGINVAIAASPIFMCTNDEEFVRKSDALIYVGDQSEN